MDNIDTNVTIDVARMQEMAFVASHSFLDTPSSVAMYNHPGVTSQWRQSELCWVFNANFSMAFEKCPAVLNCALHGDSGKVACIFMLIPNNLQFGLWEKIWAGLLLMPFRCGIPITLKLLAAADWHDKQEMSLIHDRPFLRLQRVAVDITSQGQGIGSKCLRIALDDCDKRQMPVVLGTQSLRNVRFYEKLGFKVVREDDFSPSGELGDSYHNWFMVRLPPTN